MCSLEGVEIKDIAVVNAPVGTDRHNCFWRNRSALAGIRPAAVLALRDSHLIRVYPGIDHRGSSA